MRIAIDIREAVAPDRAGKGIYNLETTRRLIENKDIEWVLFSNRETDEFDDVRVIKKKGFSWHWAVRKALIANPVDHYFAPTSYLTPLLLKDTPFSIVVHDLIAFIYPQGHSFKAKFIETFSLPKIIDKAKHIFAVSEHTKGDLLRMFPHIGSSKISVTGCGIDLERYSKGDGPDTDDPYILTLATIIPRKNYLNLIKAFELIADEIPHRLVIGGGDGMGAEQVHKYAEKSKYRERIDFLGYVDNSLLPKLYQGASAFVFPSIYEGFGIPPLEAYACGCPVTCSKASSLPEVMGEKAKYFDPFDVQDISESIIRLLENPQHTERGQLPTWDSVTSKIQLK